MLILHINLFQFEFFFLICVYIKLKYHLFQTGEKNY